MTCMKACRYPIAALFALVMVNVAVLADAWGVKYRVTNPQKAPAKDYSQFNQCSSPQA
jgi:hypothetical protein